MKNKIKFIVVAIVLCLLTGCGATKTEILTCETTQDVSGMTMYQTMDTTFTNNEVTNMKLNIDVDLGETYAPYMDTMKSTLAEEYKKFSNNGAKVDITTEGNIIKIAIDLDLTTMTKEQKQSLDIGVLDTFGTKEATKKDLEKQGYTCK